MADSKKKKPASVNKPQTVRQRASEAQNAEPKRLRKTASSVATPLKTYAGHARRVGKKEFHIPLPDNRVGKILKKRIRFLPKFVHEAWEEIKQVTWPNRRDTTRLTIAVFIFATIFAVIVGALDFVLDKAFKELIINQGK